MAKKNVGGSALSGRALDWIGTQAEEVQNPKSIPAPKQAPSPAKKKTKSASSPPAEWVRKTYLIRRDHIENVDAWAFQTKRKKKEVVEEALELYFKDKSVLSR